MLDPSDDLAAVFDGIETVSLLRRGTTPGATGTVIAHALRRAMSAVEAAVVTRGDVHKNVPSGGRHTAAAVVWHLPVVELPVMPQLGDIVLDGDGQRWTILAVKRTTVGTRWRCETKNVAVAFGLDDTISVLKAIDGSGICGPGETMWRTWQTGIRARIQPIETKITRSDTAVSTTNRYRIFVEENLELDHMCCIRGADGTIYTIMAAIGADRIGELQVIEVQVTQSCSEQ
jgi:hypothetical protein